MFLLALLLKTAIGVLIFAIGMSSTMADVVWVWQRPLLLAKSLLAMYVVVPIATTIVKAFLASYRGPQTLALVAGYLLASAVVSIPYLRWRRSAMPAGTVS